MNIPCPYNQPCIDDANSLGNFSSEELDRELFRSTYFPNEIQDGGGDIWKACYGLCVSTVSQEEADLCAQNNAKICEANKQYGNGPHTCSKVCPDGGTYSFTVPAGTFWSTESQAQADALAVNWCQNYINELCESIPGPGNPNPGPTPNPTLPPSNKIACNDAITVLEPCPDGKRGVDIPACKIWADTKISANIRARTQADEYLAKGIGCLTALPKSACVGDEWNHFVVPSLITGFIRPVNWEVFGEPPPGIEFVPQTTAMKVFGTFGAAGTFGFRLTMADPNGTFTYRVYYISVMEITESEVLTDATEGTPYINTITVVGGWDPKVFSLKLGSTLPAGLTLDPDTGVISGTPTTVGNYTFTIIVTDAEKGSCEKEFQLEVLSSLFAGWIWTPVNSITAPATGASSGADWHAQTGGFLPQTLVLPGGSFTTRIRATTAVVSNTTGAPINCQLRVVVTKTNAVPPLSNGIQSGSDAFIFNQATPVVVNVVNSIGHRANGTYLFPFVVPVGGSTWYGEFRADGSYAGASSPWIGGSNDFAVTLEIV